MSNPTHANNTSKIYRECFKPFTIMAWGSILTSVHSWLKEEFFGFYAHSLGLWGIEANPKKCMAITEIRSPKNVKKIQRLLGRLTTLSRFIPRLTKRIKPIVQLLCKAAKFQWTNECERIFLQLKVFLASPPTIEKSNATELIIVYLVVLEDTISATLV